jgi:hypothetical protein
MRAFILLTLLPLSAAPRLAAQAVERTDVPRAGRLRVTLDPTISIWDREYTPAGRVPIGAALPAPVFVHAERRVTALTTELGLPLHLSLRASLPLVRAMVRARVPLDSAGAGAALDSILADTTYAFSPVEDTRQGLRFFPGDVEVAAKVRLTPDSSRYAAAVSAVLRLPTGHLDSPNDLFDFPTGDHQRDLEVRVVQELMIGKTLWLNLSLRAAKQRPGTRERRVGPPDAPLQPHAALTRLAWDAGDYAAVDFAPLIRLGRYAGAGPTVGYFTKRRDHYTFLSEADSVALAARLGAPRSASVLDAGTAERSLRLGWAMSYVGPGVEAGLSVEQTVSGVGAAVPATTVFRIVFRTWWKLL